MYPSASISTESGFKANIPVSKLANATSYRFISRYTTLDNGEPTNDSADYYYPVVTGKAGYLDNFNIDGTHVNVSGWHADNQVINKPNHLIILFDKTKNSEIAWKNTPLQTSTDVASVIGNIANANCARFNTAFDINPNMLGDQLIAISRYSNDAKDGEGAHQDIWYGNTIDLNQQAGWLDNFSKDGNIIKASGWHAADASAAYRHHFIILYDLTSGKEVARKEVTNVVSPDVARLNGDIANAGKARFNTEFKVDADTTNDALLIISRYSDSSNGEGHYAQYEMQDLTLNTFGIANNYLYDGKGHRYAIPTEFGDSPRRD